LNPLYEQMSVSVFARMSALAAHHGAINLGQGFPDFGWPDEILDCAARALKEGSNQYAPSQGTPALREAVAAHYGRHHGLDLSADHVCVTSGATEALGAAILATVSPGDEVIIFTPAYDSYAPMIRRAGGIPREIALQPPEWRIERGAVEAAIGPNSRAIIFNNPHNPAGRLFHPDELEIIAGVARAHDLVVISDEVWEHILLDDQSFTPLASLPGMAERTIKCGSAGKIFSLTGWKIGWAAAPPPLTKAVRAAHQFITFATATPLQHGAACALSAGTEYYEKLLAGYRERRDYIVGELARIGFGVRPPAGTYYACADFSRFGYDGDDVAFCKHLIEDVGVAAIPPSAFYDRPEKRRGYVRFAFCKEMRTLEAAVERLGKLCA